MRRVIQVLIGLLIAAAIAVALVPLLVVLDIREGGDGWGLCTGGLDQCSTTYFAGFEFVAYLTVALFGVLALIAIAVRLLRYVDRRSAEGHLGAADTPSEPDAQSSVTASG